MVVAESLVAARDAARRSRYDVLPAVSDVEEALADGAPTLWADAPNNLALDNAFGDRAAVEAAIAGAHLVVEQVIRSQRTVSAFIEPRSAIGTYDEAAAIHPDLGLPGRPSPAQGSGHLSQGRRSTCARSARTSAASDRASISIPSSSRWCGRRAAPMPGEVDRRPSRDVLDRLRRATW